MSSHEEPTYERLGEDGYRELAVEFGVWERKAAPSLSPYRLSENHERRGEVDLQAFGAAVLALRPWRPDDGWLINPFFDFD